VSSELNYGAQVAPENPSLYLDVRKRVRPSLFRWRMYLYLHLLAVAALCVVVAASYADYYQNETWHDMASIAGRVFMPVAIVAIPTAYMSPFIVAMLFYRGFASDKRFFLAALAEVAIAFANWYALLPAIQ